MTEPLSADLTDAEFDVLGDLTRRPDYRALTAAVRSILATREAAHRAEVEALTAKRDRYAELLAACPLGIEGHSCCDCSPAEVEAAREEARALREAVEALVAHLTSQYKFWNEEARKRRDTFSFVHRHLYRYYTQDVLSPMVAVRAALSQED